MRVAQYYMGLLLGRKYRRRYWERHDHRYQWGWDMWVDDWPDDIPLVYYDPDGDFYEISGMKPREIKLKG